VAPPEDDKNPLWGYSTAPQTEVSPPSVKMKLVILSGDCVGQSISLALQSYRIGTDPSCDIVLKDRTVSRQHLALEVRENGVRARDLGSRNGSFYEGMRFVELEVGLGALMRVGSTEMKILPEEPATHVVPLSERTQFGELVGNSRKMRQAFTLMERLAAGDADVLIQGETGTGKELVAEAIHAASRRSAGPFVIVDLAGVAPSLIESELFGHLKGAFTGAHSDRAGAFELANGGTVMLDEVGELPLEIQPRLLRALERRHVKRVGANSYRTVDVRVLAATHVDLEAAVKAGKFREDLFHRLAVLCVMLPPLRERLEDVPLLVDTMLERMGRPLGALSEQTRALLAQYPWPGNVRELRNVIERVVSLGEQTLPKLPLPRDKTRYAFTEEELERPFKQAKERLIEGFEHDYLKSLLERCEGNISRAAREAGIARLHLRTLLKKYKLHGDEAPE